MCALSYEIDSFVLSCVKTHLIQVSPGCHAICGTDNSPVFTILLSFVSSANFTGKDFMFSFISLIYSPAQVLPRE